MTSTTPTVTDTVRCYLHGWNDHDGEAVAATFAASGTYADPTLPAPLPKAAIADYVTGLTTAFPDLVFVTDEFIVDGDRVVIPWRMQGTNAGPMPGLPEPTGRRCDLPGVDVVTVGPHGIDSVVGYFDQKTFLEQLGL
jgi:steroid delta-isomerase-like uncharacterized protein